MRVHLVRSSSCEYSLVAPYSGHLGASACFSACLIYSKCNIKVPLHFGICSHKALSQHVCKKGFHIGYIFIGLYLYDEFICKNSCNRLNSAFLETKSILVKEQICKQTPINVFLFFYFFKQKPGTSAVVIQ